VRGVIALVFLLSLTGLSLWWLLSLQADQQTDSPAESSAPRLILENFQATRLNHQGVRQYTLSAPQFIQWPGERGMEIEQPRMVLYREGYFALWHISAVQAWIAEDQRTIRLHDTVDAERQGKNPLRLRTSELSYRPREHTIATDAPVHLSMPQGTMEGQGLHGQVEQHYYTLLSAVRGRYDAPPN